MAEYTITIKDEDDGGVSVFMAGPAGGSSAASALVLNLLRMAPMTLAKLALGACQCPKCQAARAANIEPNTTIH